MANTAPKSVTGIKKYLEKQFQTELPVPDKWNPTPWMHICMPCFREDMLPETLASLAGNQSDFQNLTVWVHLNQAEGDTQAETFHIQQKAWLQSQDWPFELNVLHTALPPKKAGVGLARKIAMDSALHASFKKGYCNTLLIALDGDCTVSEQYLEAIRNHAAHHPKSPAFSVQFEHPLDGLDDKTKRGIVSYETHLRLYRYGLERIGHPYAYHTVGSAMVARGDAYAKQGGMNTKKAGEDFYFLNKLMHLGDFSHCGNATVYPSARESQRVPFGTGRAMEEYYAGKELNTYNSEIYTFLKAVFSAVLLEKKILSQTPLETAFEEVFGLRKLITEISVNTASDVQFRKRWFQKVDLFATMKMIHWLRDNAYPNTDVEEAFEELFINEIRLAVIPRLAFLRKLDSQKK